MRVNGKGNVSGRLLSWAHSWPLSLSSWLICSCASQSSSGMAELEGWITSTAESLCLLGWSEPLLLSHGVCFLVGFTVRHRNLRSTMVCPFTYLYHGHLYQQSFRCFPSLLLSNQSRSTFSPWATYLSMQRRWPGTLFTVPPTKIVTLHGLLSRPLL